MGPTNDPLSKNQRMWFELWKSAWKGWPTGHLMASEFDGFVMIALDTSSPTRVLGIRRGMRAAGLLEFDDRLTGRAGKPIRLVPARDLQGSFLEAAEVLPAGVGVGVPGSDAATG